MEKTLVKYVLALIALASTAGAQDFRQINHDCRIKSLDMAVTKTDDVLTLRAIYRGYDGAPLTLRLCPDETRPTWQADRPLTSISSSGFIITFQGRQGTMLNVSVSTTQKPAASFSFARRIFF